MTLVPMRDLLEPWLWRAHGPPRQPHDERGLTESTAPLPSRATSIDPATVVGLYWQDSGPPGRSRRPDGDCRLPPRRPDRQRRARARMSRGAVSPTFGAEEDGRA